MLFAIQNWIQTSGKHEFAAIDRPLSATAQKRLRAITSRATITSTRLVNTYDWGNFKAGPHELVARYSDAFLSGADRFHHRANTTARDSLPLCA